MENRISQEFLVNGEWQKTWITGHFVNDSVGNMLICPYCGYQTLEYLDYCPECNHSIYMEDDEEY